MPRPQSLLHSLHVRRRRKPAAKWARLARCARLSAVHLSLQFVLHSRSSTNHHGGLSGCAGHTGWYTDVLAAQVGKAANRKSANYSKTKPRYLQHLEATPVQPDTSRLDTTTIPSPSSTSSSTGSGTGGFRPPKLPPVRGSGRKAGSQSARVAVKARPQVSALAAHMPPAVPPPSSFANNGAATAR